MATRFRLNFEAILGISITALAGGTLTFCISGGSPSQLQTIYSDDGLTTPKTNPVELDSAGEHGDIFLSATDYRIIVKDADGSVVPRGDIDPYHGGLGVIPDASDFPVTATDTTEPRTLANRFADTLNVADFEGVDPTGATDSTAGIRAAIIAAYNSRLAGGLRVGLEYPAGSYKISVDYIPAITTVHQFCRVPNGAQIIPTGTMARAISSATLSGTTFAVNDAGGDASGAGMENIFVNALAANCTITDQVAYFNLVEEGKFDGFYISTDIDCDGMTFHDSPNITVERLRWDRIGATSHGTGLTISGQTNKATFNGFISNGKWVNNILNGGSGNTFQDGDFEGNGANAILNTGENTSILRNHFENVTTGITDGIAASATANSTTIDDNTFAGVIGTAYKIVSSGTFHWRIGNRALSGSTVTNFFSGVAATADCNGIIDIFGDPAIFTTASINMASKGAVTVNVYGTSTSGNPSRYAQFETETNRRLSPVIGSIAKAALTGVLAATACAIGVTVFVNDEAGGAVLCFTDQTNWRRVTDRAVVS